MKQGKNRHSAVLGVLFLGVLMAAVDIAIVGPAFPAIRRTFGISDRAVAWVFTLYLLLNLIGTPVMAKLSDRLGRRLVYVADILLFVLGSLLVALAPTFSFVLLGRAIQGFGSGGIFPVASAVIGDVFPPEKRGRALGMIGAVFGLAFLIGPILAGVILRLFSWRMLFWGPIPFAAVLVPLSWRFLPPKAPGAAGRPDWAGVILLAVILTGLAVGTNQINAAALLKSLGSPGVWISFGMAFLALPFFWRTERRAEDPLIHPELLATRQLRLAGTLTFGAGVVEGAMVFIPALLVAAFGVTESQASFMLLPLVLTLAVGSPAFGWLLDRWGSRRVILIGTSLIVLGTWGLGFVPLSFPSFYTAGALIGFGLSALLGAPIRYIMLNEAPPAYRAAAQALVSLLTKVGQILTGASIGAIAASFGGGARGYLQAFRTLGFFSLFLLGLALHLKSRREERERVVSHVGLILAAFGLWMGFQ